MKSPPTSLDAKLKLKSDAARKRAHRAAFAESGMRELRIPVRDDPDTIDRIKRFAAELNDQFDDDEQRVRERSRMDFHVPNDPELRRRIEEYVMNLRILAEGGRLFERVDLTVGAADDEAVRFCIREFANTLTMRFDAGAGRTEFAVGPDCPTCKAPRLIAKS